MVETVGSTKLADALNVACRRHRAELPPLEVLVQLNTSNEEDKSGASTCDDAHDIARHITDTCDALKFAGFMTIGAYANSMVAANESESTQCACASRAQQLAAIPTSLHCVRARTPTVPSTVSPTLTWTCQWACRTTLCRRYDRAAQTYASAARYSVHERRSKVHSDHKSSR